MTRLDLPLAVIAVAATAALFIFTGSQVQASRCRAQGGRMMHHGMDAACTRPDRSTVQVEVLPATPEGRALMVVVTAAAAWTTYLGLRRFVRSALRHE
jgi:hypothetical protein